MDILPENLKENIPKYEKNPVDFDIPWLIHGAPILQMKTRFLPEQIFSRGTITRYEVLRHLYKIYRGSLLAMTANDYDFLQEYLEETFHEKLSKKLKTFEEKKYTFDLLEDFEANNGVRMMPEMYLYDNIIIKGLDTNRKNNLKLKDYSICDDINDMGFISYLSKDLYNPQNFISREKGDEIIESNNIIIYRAYCMFKSGLKLFLRDEIGKDVYDYDKNYTYNHVAIFECKMTHPEKFTSYSKTETYTEWIAKHKFGTWRLIDLDNWMKGNHYLIE
jgi:hypothetical protein